MLQVDAQRRRDRAERLASQTPPEEVAIRNKCAVLLAELDDPKRALDVLLRLQRSVTEVIELQRRGLV